MTLKELIQEKAKILLEAESNFIDGIKSTEAKIFSEVLKILRGLAQQENRLDKSQLSSTVVGRIAKAVLKTIRESTLQKKLDKFIPNFDKIDKLNDSIYKDLTDRSFTNEVKKQLSVLQKIKVDEITNGVTNEANINANFVNRIRDILANGIATRSKVSDVENALRDYIKGTGKRGAFSRYLGQISRDALNQYDGAINDVVRDAYQLDGFFYVNPTVKDSRDNCVDMVNGSGRFSEFAIRPGLYRVEDIPKILAKARKGKSSGYNPLVTPETFSTYRFGWNCNHACIYVDLDSVEAINI